MACTRASQGKDVLPALLQGVAPGSTTMLLSGEASLIGIQLTSLQFNWNIKHYGLWLKIHNFDQYDTEVVLGCLAPSVFHKIPIAVKSKGSLGSVMCGEKSILHFCCSLIWILWEEMPLSGRRFLEGQTHCENLFQYLCESMNLVAQWLLTSSWRNKEIISRFKLDKTMWALWHIGPQFYGKNLQFLWQFKAELYNTLKVLWQLHKHS